jgi:hypothetical protein
MSDPIIPTPQDTQLLLQDTTTKTASYNTPAMDLGAGRAPGGLGQPLAAVVLVTALDLTSGNESYSLALQESADNASFSAIGPTVAVSATGALAVSGRARQRYVRLALVAGGTTPSISFKAWLNPLP